MLNCAVPAEIVYEVVPAIVFVVSVSSTVQLPVNMLLSSPNKFTVIENVKFVEGVRFEEVRVILYTKLTIFTDILLIGVIPVDAAFIVNAPAVKILILVKIQCPEEVEQLVVPEKVPVGLSERVIVYGPLDASKLTPKLS